MGVFEAFKAGSTRRWHTHERLSQTVDRVDGHSARVARIIFMLNPAPSMSLVLAALIHDDGEQSIGDIKGPAKAQMPDDLRAAFEEIERDAIVDIWGNYPYLTDRETLWLKFADRLDAIMWCAFYAPDLIDRTDWQASIKSGRRMAIDLGVEGAFDLAVFEAYQAGGGE